MEHTTLYLRFGTALFLGIMIGMQREYAAEENAKRLYTGIRTFSLLALIGCAAAMLSDLQSSALPFTASLLVVGGFLAINYFVSAEAGRAGLTTKTAALLTMLAGALAYWDQMALAVALGVVTTLLLSAKSELHAFAQHITREDVFATLKFAVIAVIVLPVLPNRRFGPPPLDIFNPFKIWLLVVFISGISFVGYVLTKVYGSEKGIRLTGLLGGLTSSTAVTLSVTQRSKECESLGKTFATAVTVAWAIMFARVIVVAAVINMELAARIAVPLLVAMALGMGYCAYLYFRERASGAGGTVALTNPFKLGPAVRFGLIFTAVMAFARAAHAFFGETGVYFSSFLTGLADVDAITVSLARLSGSDGELPMKVASASIVVAAIANTLTKGLIALLGGSTSLKKEIVPGWIMMMAGAGVTMAITVF